MEVDNDFLLRMDSEAMLMLLGNDKNLSDISFLEFRKHLYKKYYIEEEDA